MEKKALTTEEPVFIPNKEYIALLQERAAYLKEKHKRSVSNKIVNGYARIKEIERSMSSIEIIKNTKIAFSN